MTLPEMPNLDMTNASETEKQLYSYVVDLKETMEFWMRNLDKSNFNDAGLTEIGDVITKPIAVKVEEIADDYVTSSELSVTANQIQSTVEASVAEDYATKTQLTQTASSITSTVASVQSTANSAMTKASTVEQTVDGLSITTSGGTSYISGDHISSGTIQGVEVISANGSTHAHLGGGRISLGGAISYEPAEIYYNPSNSKLYIYCDNNIQLESSGGVSIKAGTAGSDCVDIGGANQDVYLTGNVYINGVLQ